MAARSPGSASRRSTRPIAIEAAGGGIDVDIPGAATTGITGAEAALDELFVDGEAGADTFSVVGPVASLIKLVTNQ
jgi:hypothetical protein